MKTKRKVSCLTADTQEDRVIHRQIERDGNGNSITNETEHTKSRTVSFQVEESISRVQHVSDKILLKTADDYRTAPRILQEFHRLDNQFKKFKLSQPTTLTQEYFDMAFTNYAGVPLVRYSWLEIVQSRVRIVPFEMAELIKMKALYQLMRPRITPDDSDVQIHLQNFDITNGDLEIQLQHPKFRTRVTLRGIYVPLALIILRHSTESEQMEIKEAAKWVCMESLNELKQTKVP